MTNLSPEQQKYYAWLLTCKKSGDDDMRLAGVLSEAKVDLNPHQVEAALFALRSPFSKGVILADEVGLGKTIEAGIVISQTWAEMKRHILIIVPATLRRQWMMEMEDKFYLQSEILERKSTLAPDILMRKHRIFICSYQYAARHAEELKAVNWNLVVIDEAHKLRNVCGRERNS
jgi:SNF2 family DNA or RNA helicase